MPCCRPAALITDSYGWLVVNGVTPLLAILSRTPLMYAATSIVASSAFLMNGCSSSLLYFGRCVSSLIKLNKQHRTILISKGSFWLSRRIGRCKIILPCIHKVHKVHSEVIAVLIRRKSRRITLHYLIKLFEDRVPLWVREVSCSNLHQRNT